MLCSQRMPHVDSLRRALSESLYNVLLCNNQDKHVVPTYPATDMALGVQLQRASEMWDMLETFCILTAIAAAQVRVTRVFAAQVFHLKEAGVECGYLSGTQDYAESREIMQGLTRDPPAVKILFVTPEKVARSDYLMRTLDSLHSRCQLARSLPPTPPLQACVHP